MNNGKVIFQIGNKQGILDDRGFYSKNSCDLIEHIISCNKTELSEYGGSGRIRFLNSKDNMVVQLTIAKGKSFLSDESKAIVLIRGISDTIKSNAYYGSESELDFVSSSDVYSLEGVHNYIESLKSFYKSWQVKKGEICSVVVIVDKKSIFDLIIKDKFFNNCYVLLAE